MIHVIRAEVYKSLEESSYAYEQRLAETGLKKGCLPPSGLGMWNPIGLPTRASNRKVGLERALIARSAFSSSIVADTHTPSPQRFARFAKGSPPPCFRDKTRHKVKQPPRTRLAWILFA